MPRVLDDVYIPGLVAQSVAQAIVEFQRREFALGDDIRDLYNSVFGTYRTDLERFFLRHFYKTLNENNEPVWEPLKAKELNASQDFITNMDELLISLEEEAEDIMDEDLTEGYWEGNSLELWMLAQSGIDISEIPDYDMSIEATKPFLLAAGIGGLGYTTRLKRWTKNYRMKFSSFFKAAIAGGLTLDATLTGFDSIRKGIVSSIVSLGQNELKNAFTQGAVTARKQYKDEIEGEVWITRDDPLVCPICRRKHLTITKDQPIVDSHPGCRCNKAPIALNYRGEPIDYVAFLQSIRRR